MDFYEYEELLEEENRQALQHHGIAGMKWFHRNGPPYPIPKGGHSAAEKKADPSVDKNAPSAPKKRRVSELSDKELRERTERLRLENEFTRQSYEQLKLAQGPQIQQGKTFLQKAADVSKQVNTIAVNTNSILKVFTGQDIAHLIGKKAGVDVDAAKAVKNSDAMKEFENQVKKSVDKAVEKETKKKEAKEAKKSEAKADKEVKKESKKEERSYWNVSESTDRYYNYSDNPKTETYKQSEKRNYKVSNTSNYAEIGSEFIGSIVNASTKGIYELVDESNLRVDMNSAEDWLKRIGAY